MHLVTSEGGRLVDAWLPTAKPEAKEPTGWIVDRRCDDRLELNAAGCPAAARPMAAGCTSELRSTSGDGLKVYNSVPITGIAYFLEGNCTFHHMLQAKRVYLYRQRIFADRPET